GSLFCSYQDVHVSVNDFNLPSRDAKFVEERRKQLQNYLRNVMNKVIQALPEFIANPKKETLIQLMPFFVGREEKRKEWRKGGREGRKVEGMEKGREGGRKEGRNEGRKEGDFQPAGESATKTNHRRATPHFPRLSRNHPREPRNPEPQ
ncbi:Sorting nexin-29, partial [Ophiophagus hannah]